MANVLDRIHKLLALSASPNVEEARTACHKAAKLILEHQIELRMPGTNYNAADQKLSSDFTKFWNDLVGDVERKQRAHDMRYHEARARERVSYTENSKPVPPRDPRASGRQRADPPPWKMIKAIRESSCDKCKKKIKFDESLWWRKGGDVMCVRCYAFEAPFS